MRSQVRKQVRKIDPSRFVTGEDFINVFHEDSSGLYRLSFLLTVDHEKQKGVL